MTRSISLRHKLTGMGACVIALTAQLICNALLLSDKEALSAPLMIEWPIPLIALLLFAQGTADGGWTLITVYALIMSVFWATGAHLLLEEPVCFMVLLLINMGGLGTYLCYSLFRYLRKRLSPEYELVHRQRSTTDR